MPTKQAAVLVVDDEPSIAGLLSEDLIEEGYNCITAATGEDALRRLSKSNFDAILLDLKLPGISGMDVLKEVKSNRPEIAIIVVTSAGDAQTAVEAMKIGAVDYITKPFDLERINSSIEAALKTRTVGRDKAARQEESAEGVSEEVDWIRCLDNIVEGVGTRLDSLAGHVMSITVIEQTIDAARCLEIPDEYIEKWADGRRKDIERVKILDSLIEKRI
ncbi:response regulator [Chloroflexota bacterium]